MYNISQEKIDEYVATWERTGLLYDLDIDTKERIAVHLKMTADTILINRYKYGSMGMIASYIFPVVKRISVEHPFKLDFVGITNELLKFNESFDSEIFESDGHRLSKDEYILDWLSDIIDAKIDFEQFKTEW